MMANTFRTLTAVGQRDQSVQEKNVLYYPKAPIKNQRK